MPPESSNAAQVPGLHAIRSFGDTMDPVFLEEIRTAGQREIDALRAAGKEIGIAEYLAISGGGANGAYGAGLLCGWTASGTRPKFKIVTGVSTGALTAPFAFLGPAYDDTLREVYTTVRTKDILKERNLISGFFGDAFADSCPLQRLLRRKVDASVMNAIAAEYAEGRILLVGTTNLDAERPVVWNVTAIAASGHPRALELIHAVLLASASIPVGFPPVMIDVEVDGRRYQEMHVDGGTSNQVFFYPPAVKISEAAGIDRERRLYLIRNSRVDAEWANVKRDVPSIASRSIDSLIHTQALGDLYRIYATSVRDHVDYNLAFIPPTFEDKPRELFDPPYMQKLFDIGYADGTGGAAWHKKPPGTTPDSQPGPLGLKADSRPGE